MSHFDQRGQKVGKQVNIAGDQYNAGGNIVNIEGDVQPGAVVAGGDAEVRAVLGDIGALLRQLHEAAQFGQLDAAAALDAEYALKKAELEAAKNPPDKPKCLQHLETAHSVLEKIVGASKSAAIIGAAIGTVIAKVKGWLP